MAKTFRKGGVHPPQNKITADIPIIAISLPREAAILLSQHIGAPATPCVNKGDKVKRGDKIAIAGGFVSANIHTPISGTVAKIDKVKGQNGYMADAIIITATEEEHEADQAARLNVTPTRTESEIDNLTSKEIVDIIAEAGIVGLGGATFPTHVKLSPPPGNKAEVVIINGAECEPYLTNDDQQMRSAADETIGGIALLMKGAGVDLAKVGVEQNKPEAIEALREAVKKSGIQGIEIVPLKVKYPQGGEKQLIKAIIDREVPSGALPIATGAIVQNVATARAVYRAVKYGEPLIERIATVTGDSVANPGNFLIAIGTPLTSLLEAAGGIPEGTGKIISGGPMMGRTIVNVESPAVKGTSALLLIPEEGASRGETKPCIRCGRCVEVCPMGLEPYLISTLSRLGRYEDAEPEHIMDCIECGSCSYTCPSWRPLLDYIRLGKNKVGAIIRARKSLENK